MLGSLRFEIFYIFALAALGAGQAALDFGGGYHFGLIVSGRLDDSGAAGRQVVDCAGNSLRGSA
jgi:hypothetical protein